MAAAGADAARRLSVAMIVRDEAPLLGECIEQARRHVDEICVVDTGSEDDSRAIAEAAGCVTSAFPWCGDFAAARNASLELCSGAWIFVLDADERFADADWRALRALIQGDDRACYRFTTRNYTNSTALTEFHPCMPGESEALLPAAADGAGFAGWYPSSKVRLFPNVPEARFEGEVHEMVHTSLVRAGIEVRTSDIPIHHYPQARSAARQSGKRAAYLQLGLEKVRRNPEDAYAHAELADQYAEMGDYAAAAQSYREALRRNPGQAAWLAHLGATLHLLGRGKEAEQALTLALKAGPDAPGTLRNLAAVQSAAGRWEEAVASLERAVACCGTNPGLLLADLALALESAGRLEEGAAAARKALEVLPVPGPNASRYAGLMERTGRADEARAFLEALAKRTGDPRFRDPHSF